MEKNKKGMRTSLTRWLNHSINRQSKNPHSQHPTDGDLTGLMTANRWTPNVFLNTKKKISTPFKCPDCGRTISSKSNLFKHRQTNICMRKKCKCWKVLQNTLWYLSFKGFFTHFCSITIIFIETVFLLISNPSPRNSNRQPMPKIYSKICHLIG